MINAFTILGELLVALFKLFSGQQAASHDKQEQKAGADAVIVQSNQSEADRINMAADAGNAASRLSTESAITDPDNIAKPKTPSM